METGGSIGLEIGKLIIGDGEILEGAYVGVNDGVISEVSGDGFEASYDEVIDLGAHRRPRPHQVHRSP